MQHIKTLVLVIALVVGLQCLPLSADSSDARISAQVIIGRPIVLFVPELSFDMSVAELSGPGEQSVPFRTGDSVRSLHNGSDDQVLSYGTALVRNFTHKGLSLDELRLQTNVEVEVPGNRLTSARDGGQVVLAGRVSGEATWLPDVYDEAVVMLTVSYN